MDVDLTILPKAWMRLRGMHIKQSRRFGCWTYSFRPISVVHNDSPIFYACKDGSIDEILQLVQTGRASLFDTSQEGYNLIHFAALHLRADLCRWLLTQGVQATETEFENGETALHVASHYVDKDYRDCLPLSLMDCQFFENMGRHSDAIDTIRVLIEVGQCDPMQKSNFSRTSLSWYTGVELTESFNYMLNQECILIGLDPENDIMSLLDWHVETGSHYFVDTIIKFMMKSSIKFSRSRSSRDGFPSCPHILHTALELLSDIICDPKARCKPATTNSLNFGTARDESPYLLPILLYRNTLIALVPR